MNSRFKIYLIFFILLHSILFSNNEILWQEIMQGCYYSKYNIYYNNEIADTVNILKLNPRRFYLKIFYKEKEKGLPEMYDIKEWHEKYPDANIFINGSYYDEYRKPTTAIWMEGVCINRKNGILNKGALFYCLQNQDGSFYNDLIDLNSNSVDVAKEKFFYAIQSMPILILNGQIVVKKSDWKANRTVVAKDKDGNIIIVVTEASSKYKSFTLYDMARWLAESDLNITIAVNLDGGYESQLSIKTSKLKYTTIGQWETNGTGDISKQGLKIKIPVVIGFYLKN